MRAIRLPTGFEVNENIYIMARGGKTHINRDGQKTVEMRLPRGH